jgi:hypothetical protein
MIVYATNKICQPDRASRVSGSNGQELASQVEKTTDEEAQKLLKKVVSRLGLEPRALALKAPPLLKKFNAMTLLNRPMSDKHLQ